MTIHQLTISGKDAKKIVDTTGIPLSFEKLVDCDEDEFYAKYGMLTSSLYDEKEDEVVERNRQLVKSPWLLWTKEEKSELYEKESLVGSPWFNLFTGEILTKDIVLGYIHQTQSLLPYQQHS